MNTEAEAGRLAVEGSRCGAANGWRRQQLTAYAASSSRVGPHSYTGSLVQQLVAPLAHTHAAPASRPVLFAASSLTSPPRLASSPWRT